MIPQLRTLSRGEPLSAEAASEAMHTLMRGEADPVHIAGLLMGLRARGETVTELTAFARVMRSYAVPVPCDDPHAIDLCGTGGDSSGTYNISTAAAFVCAGAGIAVAKHGNRSVSSQCGSADVLEALGVNIDLGPDGVRTCLEACGVAFIFARHYHPAMKHVMPVRRTLASRTCFNILGPLCNPAGVRRQIVGTFSAETAETMAQILVNLGARHIITLSATDGLDEISLSSPTLAFEFAPGYDEVRRHEITPEMHGYMRAPLTTLQGGQSDENARIIRSLLEGQDGPMRDVLLLNSTYGLWVSGRFESLGACKAAAIESVDSRRALSCLAKLRSVSQTA
ncbi:MAG: anthranilate phosphoribosyltransferase [Bacteroidota bacterium]|nr:anthranilate phosphoribosyltransferase [Bacteroidota bacterium]